MKLNEIKRGKAHIFYTMVISSFSVILNCFINLYLTPKITNSVGVEAYGFVSLSKNFVTYANIVMTALNSYAARYMSISYLQGKFEEYKKYFSTVFIADFVIGGLIFILGLVGTFKLEILLNVPTNIMTDVKLLFVFTFATFYLTTISTVFFATGYVKDRLDLVNGIKALSYVVEIACLIFCFIILKPKVTYVGLATFAAALIIFSGTVLVTNRLVPESRISISYFNNSALKKLVLAGIWNSANSMGNALNSGLDLLVSNILLSALSMGQVSIAKTIGNLIYTLYATISQPFQPTFLKKYSEGDLKGLVHELKYSMKICGIITNVVFSGFVVLGFKFYELWIPTQNISLVYKLTVIAMLPCITEGCMYPIYYIYTLTVKNKIPCLITILGGLLNVIGMIALLKWTDLGVYSIVITTAVIMNFINLVTNPLYMAHCLKLRKSVFYPSILLNLVLCIASVISMKFVIVFLPTESNWFVFLLDAFICAIFGIISQTLVAFKPSEVKQVLKTLKLRK